MSKKQKNSIAVKEQNKPAMNAQLAREDHSL